MAEDKKITLTYLNIRQSIAILLARLTISDILMAAVVIFLYSALITGSSFVNYNEANTALFLTSFILLGILKLGIASYVVLQWLNEYYEITPDYIYHKKGILFKKVEKYRIDNIREIDVVDNFLGEALNFATISILDIRRNKYLDMYLIHNPDRYVKILKQLCPRLEIKEDRTSIPFIVDGEKSTNNTEE